MINYGMCEDLVYSIIGNINHLMYSIVTFLLNDTLITEIESDTRLSGIIDAIKATAITLCVMFFFIDFFTKTLHLQWVTWENVMMLFLKLIAAKVCVENSVWITDCIYKGLSEMVSDVAGTTSSGLYITQLIPIDELGWDKAALLLVSQQEWTWITTDYNPGGWLNLQPVILYIRILFEGLLMAGVMLIANVIVLGRMFELTVYTLIAPVPLSTFACDGLTDVGKGFLKSYASVVLQALVLLIMFVAYSASLSLIMDLETSDGQTFIRAMSYGGLLLSITFCAAVIKSGEWAKRICGAA